MSKRVAGETYSLKILNVLMNTKNHVSTTELCNIVGCERKTIYSSIERLEISGFGIEVIEGNFGEPNRYRFIGLFGF